MQRKFWYRLIAEKSWHAARRIYSPRPESSRKLVVPEADDPSFDPSLMAPGDWLISESGAWHPVTALAEVIISESAPTNQGRESDQDRLW